MSASIFQLIVLPRLAQLSGRVSTSAWVSTASTATFAPCQCQYRRLKGTAGRGRRSISTARSNSKAAAAYAYAETIAEEPDRDSPLRFSGEAWGRGDDGRSRGVLGDGHDPPAHVVLETGVGSSGCHVGDSMRAEAMRGSIGARSGGMSTGRSAGESAEARTRGDREGAVHQSIASGRYKSPKRERYIPPPPVFPDRPDSIPDLSWPTASRAVPVNAAPTTRESSRHSISMPLTTDNTYNTEDRPETPLASPLSPSRRAFPFLDSSPSTHEATPSPSIPSFADNSVRREPSLSLLPQAPPTDPFEALKHIPGGLKRVRQLSVLSDALDIIERCFLAPPQPHGTSTSGTPTGWRKSVNVARTVLPTISTRIRLRPPSLDFRTGKHRDAVSPMLSRLLDAGFFRLITLHILRTPMYANDARLVKAVSRRLQRAGAWGLADKLREGMGMQQRDVGEVKAGDSMVDKEAAEGSWGGVSRAGDMQDAHARRQARVQEQAQAHRAFWRERDAESASLLGATEGQKAEMGQGEMTALYNSHLARALSGSRIIASSTQTMPDNPNAEPDVPDTVFAPSPSSISLSTPTASPAPIRDPTPTPPNLLDLSHPIFPSNPLPTASATYAQLRALLLRISSLESSRGFRPDMVTANLVIKSWVACWAVKRLIKATYVEHCHGRNHGKVGETDEGAIEENENKKGSKSARRRAAVLQYGKEAVAARARELRAQKAARAAKHGGKGVVPRDGHGHEAASEARSSLAKGQSPVSSLPTGLSTSSALAPNASAALSPATPGAESPRSPPRRPPAAPLAGEAMAVAPAPSTSPSRSASRPPDSLIQTDHAISHDASQIDAEAETGMDVDPKYETEPGALFRFVSGLYEAELGRIEREVRQLLEPFTDTSATTDSTASAAASPGTSASSPSSFTLLTATTSPSDSQSSVPEAPPLSSLQTIETQNLAVPDHHTILQICTLTRDASHLYRLLRACTNPLGKAVWRHGEREHELGTAINAWKREMKERVEGLEDLADLWADRR